jgi:hypothetical protein
MTTCSIKSERLNGEIWHPTAARTAPTKGDGTNLECDGIIVTGVNEPITIFANN